MSKIGKGRHTSSSVVLFDLPQGGMVIDTPGIRSFGLAHVTADDVLAAFDEIAEAAVDCPPLCGHTAEDPECALDAWAAAGPPARQEQLAALRVLLGAVGQVGPRATETAGTATRRALDERSSSPARRPRSSSRAWPCPGGSHRLLGAAAAAVGPQVPRRHSAARSTASASSVPT